MGGHDINPYRYGRGKLPNLVEPMDGASNQLENTAGSTIDPATFDAQEDILAALTGDQYTREIGKARLMDSGGVLVDPLDADAMAPTSDTTSDSGEAAAATLDLGAHRKSVDVFYDVGGPTSVHVEVSTDGSAWRPLQTEDVDAGEGFVQVETAYQHVRAWADSDVNLIEVASKGD